MKTKAEKSNALQAKSVKMDRVDSELGRQISKVISQDIKDPRIGDSIVSVTKVYTTPDLKFAKVYLSVYNMDKDKIKVAFDTIVRSKSFIRNMLKTAVQIRTLPDLIFVLDDSVDFSINIEHLLSQIEIPKEDLTDNVSTESDKDKK
ncbi:MAG: 30S ribosome-binding factor RbfA [Clostridia bacterium]